MLLMGKGNDLSGAAARTGKGEEIIRIRIL